MGRDSIFHQNQFENTSSSANVRICLLRYTFYSLENFRHFIKNISSIPENRKTRFRNFQKYLLRISQLKTGNGKVNADIIRLDLSKEYKIINRKWLTEKIDEASK
ncbi:MAG: hypothetical protein JSS91_02775 [Bacteroidetes bacterium]|nr:hypothetical protein [Bacteroidota bacterium]